MPASPSRSSSWTSSAENYDAVLDVNLRGTLYMSQAVVPQMRQQRSGSIVCMSSVSAQRGGGIFGGPHYSAAKGGVLGLGKAMARELGPDNVRVNSITPGLIQTDITGGKLTDDLKAEIIKGIPLGRLGVADDIGQRLPVPRLRPVVLHHRRHHRRERRHADPLSCSNGPEEDGMQRAKRQQAAERAEAPPDLSNEFSLEDRAYRIRRNALRMGEVQGQGYIAQALGIADVLAVSYFHAMRYRPDDPEWEGRDRFLLSIGHYAIALYAALIEAGIIPEDELESYGSDDSRLPMSGMAAYTPGMEITGGSLGHGLALAVGFCLGLKRKKSDAFVYCLFSDGEFGEGSIWEGAWSASHWKLDNLIGIVDVNNQQADGPAREVTGFEPLDKRLRGVRLARAARERQRHRRARDGVRRGARAHGAEAAHRDLRHQDGQGHPVPGGAGEEPLPARRTAGMAGRAEDP